MFLCWTVSLSIECGDEDGIAMRGQAHKDETRAQVIAALLAGQGVNEVSRQYSIPKATVSRIKNGLAVEQLEHKKLSDLVEEHLTESLKAATAIAQKVSNDAWFFKQNAADIGVLYGILTDKSIRILEAAESANAEGSAESSLVH